MQRFEMAPLETIDLKISSQYITKEKNSKSILATKKMLLLASFVCAVQHGTALQVLNGISHIKAFEVTVKMSTVKSAETFRMRSDHLLRLLRNISKQL